MKKFQSFLCLLLVAVSLSSCDPNDSNTSSQNDDTFAQNFGSDASRDFIGQVVDVDNHPIQGVSIKIGNSTVQTDSNGVFIINGANVYQKFAYITAKKSGYIDGSRSMVPTNGKNNVKIMLLPNAPLETIQSGMASEVSIYSGTKVTFDGAFQDENGATYTGAVQVSMFHLTPSDENISKLMPGMLYAQTETNQEAVLETFGMLNVELRGSAGQKLNIKEGHTAEITMRIDDSQIATAPSSIPLWHFDEEKGYWKQDGVATKVGNKYVGEVSHFSWWNYDVDYSTITLTTKFINSSGVPLQNIGCYLYIASSNFNGPGLQYSDSNGEISGYIPNNILLHLLILDDCSNILYSQDIGPLTVDTVLPDIVINPSFQSTTINGSLLKCDNTNVTNGYILMVGNDINTSNNILQYVDNGTFSFLTYYCSPNFTIEGYDFDNQNTSSVLNYTHVSPINNIGNIMACLSINEYITYQIDGGASILLNANIIADYNPINGFNLYATNFQNYLEIHGSTDSLVTYTTANGFAINQDIYPFIFINNSNPNTVVFQITNFGIVGQYIDITFNGTYIENNGSPITRTISGSAHVFRDH